MDIDKMLKAIEHDAGQKIPGLAESLAEAKAGKIGRAHTPEQILLKSARKALKFSQPQFADWIGTPVGTLRDWEQGRFPVPGAVMRLLQIAINHPEVAQEA
ncbi:MAG: XRE family transcriptional regulator [Pseudohongiella sp.]|nr:XRE family transcriptional regulator [Pseudohongiella sp.]